jgi:ABC-type sugar transport system ATPase subunit
MLQIQANNRGGELAPPDVVISAATKRYAGTGRPIFDNLDLVCPAGRITVIVGPSGCGKTTLLRCVCGLEAFGGGSIRFDDLDVTRVDAQHRGVAMVFQNYALYPSKTVAENIAFPLRMAGIGTRERQLRVEAAARLVKIEELLARRPAHLSGGQRQRVGIARAIVRGPRVLLMDEPLSNLDTKLRAEMRGELAALQRKIGATTIYVTHDQIEALSLADHLIIMRDGAIEQQGSPADVFRKPASTFVADFLGAMNLIGCRGEGKTLRLDAKQSIALPQQVSVAQPLVLGFRSEDVRLASSGGSEISFPAAVLRTELLGSDSLIHLSVAGKEIRARSQMTPEPGNVLQLFIAAENIHYFSADGRRMDPGTKGDP